MKALWTLSLLFFASSISAKQSNDQFMYLGLNFARTNIEFNVDNVGSLDISNSLIGGTVGYQFHRNFSIEARGYGNLSDNSYSGNKIELKSHFSAVFRAILPINQYFKPYAILGYGTSELSVNSLSESDEDIVYGMGMSINKGEPLHLEVEWVNIYDKNFSELGGSIDAYNLNLNLVYHFQNL